MDKAFKQSGVAAFPDAKGPSGFRFAVSAEHEKLHVRLEDTSTKAQWQTEQLSLADFVTLENAIPQASVAMYAKWFAESLAQPDLLPNSTPSISDSLEDGSRRLLIVLPLQTLATTTSLEYSFRLMMVELERVDVLDARVNDVEASMKAVVDEVATLRRENAELAKRLDLMNIDHGHQVRLMQKEAVQLQKSQQANMEAMEARIVGLNRQMKLAKEDFAKQLAPLASYVEAMGRGSPFMNWGV